MWHGAEWVNGAASAASAFDICTSDYSSVTISKSVWSASRYGRLCGNAYLHIPAGVMACFGANCNAPPAPPSSRDISVVINPAWPPSVAGGVAIDKFGGGPVGLETLAAAVGEDKGTLEEVLEPFLIHQGFLDRTPRGRVATQLALEFWRKA